MKIVLSSKGRAISHDSSWFLCVNVPMFLALGEGFDFSEEKVAENDLYEI